MPRLPALTSRRPGAWLLASSLLCGCGLSVYSGATESSTTSSNATGDPTGAPTSGSTSAGSDPTTGATSIATTATGTSTDGTTTGATTTGDTSTGDTSTTAVATDASTGSSTSDTSTGGVVPDKMETWGHGCMFDDDCMAIVGDKGICLHDVLDLYGLPGGYCTKTCQLPDLMTMYVPDDPICGPGVHCVGVMGYFEACLVECFDDSECPREGYECRVLPEIGQPGDPMFCLMTDDNKL